MKHLFILNPVAGGGKNITRSGEIRPARTSYERKAAAQTNLAQSTAAKPDPTRTDTVQTATVQTNPAETTPVRTNPAKPPAAQLNYAKTTAAKTNSGEIEREILRFAETLSDPYEIYITKAPMDACRKIIDDAETTDMLRVYACGGDGTLSECANGAALRDNVAITHYPCGTGNDFIKTFGEDNIAGFHDLEALTKGEIRPIDLIDCNGRYGINICSVGIDARVGTDVHKYSRIPLIGGATGYVVSLIVNVVKGIGQNLRVSTGEGTWEKDISLICACNGKYYGGGFNPVPEALPDDGILEYLIVDGVSRLKVAQIIGKYAKGRFRELGEVVKYIRGGSIQISCEHEIVVNIDGEAVYSKEVVFKAVPKGLNFIFPAQSGDKC